VQKIASSLSPVFRVDSSGSVTVNRVPCFGLLQLQFIEFDLRELLEKTSLPHSVQCAVPKRMLGDPRRLRQIVEMFGSEPGTSLTVELESADASQVCLYFAFGRRCAPEGDVTQDALTRRLATQLVTLMGGRIWSDLNSPAGLQFHAMFPTPGRVSHTEPGTGNARRPLPFSVAV
jgi:hypothetical protein